MSTKPLSFTPTLYAEKLRVRGIVQGVGFRPTVWKIAQQFGLVGTVSNDGDGVLIEVQGKSFSINAFVEALSRDKPPLARIDSIERERLECADKPASGFAIIKSTQSRANTGVMADAATCKNCLADILDKTNRRYSYPFTNCTHCGPRLSIIRGIPYDREQTSMDEFKMCPICLREYKSVENRRFHAQPNACPVCGPEIWLEDNTGRLVSSINKSQRYQESGNSTPVTKAGLLIREKAIVAIKGIGGIHLAVSACDDGSSASAVQKLRQKKQRPRKPFAVMAKDMAMIKTYCHVSDEEQALLTSPAAPIVLLQKRKNAQKKIPLLSENIAPGQETLGMMLPYSPLHHMLLQLLNRPIVLTSANASHEPQCIDNDQAREVLRNIADYFLLHNRTIENRVDDSVVRIMAGKPQFYRRARGYAPESLPLPKGFESTPEILALGSELKNTFCLIKNGQAILAQHMGDLEHYKTYKDYRHNLALYEKLFQHQAKHIAIDAHPEYLSNKVGHEIANERGFDKTQLHSIQHHHAHIASCLADNHYPHGSATVLGIALDGLGYGSDNTLWGGEFLLANYQQSKRLAYFKPIALLGASAAMKQPWRNTYSHLQTCLTWDWVAKTYPKLELVKKLSKKPLATFNAMIRKGINCPKASSAGRFFDAVAGALGICQEEIQYEGQAAIELENCIDEQAWIEAKTTAYTLELGKQLDPTHMWKELLQDLSTSTSTSLISARFHKGLSNAIQAMASKLAKENNVNTIAISGGVFQNKTLFEDVKQGLEQQNFAVLAHRNVPANDGGLALGQAVITAARLQKRSRKEMLCA